MLKKNVASPNKKRLPPMNNRKKLAEKGKKRLFEDEMDKDQAVNQHEEKMVMEYIDWKKSVYYKNVCNKVGDEAFFQSEDMISE